MATYDLTRWFEMLRTSSVEEVKAELYSNDRLFLLNATDTEAFNQTCVFYAANDDNEERGDTLMQLLISEGANACYKDGLEQTAVFYAACKGHRTQIEALVQNGADPGEVDTYGQSPVFYAAREGHIHILEQLVTQHQVNVNQVDNTGQSSLFYACRDGRLDAVRFLVEHGNINIHQEDKQKQTALTWAKRQQKNEIVEYLISKGVTDPTKKKKEEAVVPKPRGKAEKKLKCQLMVVNEVGEKRPATDEELRQFEESYPDVARFWKHPEAVQELDKISLEELDAIKPWEKAGKKLMNMLWRTTHAWIFHEPVDPIKLDIEDYFDIIKRPMDFGTIKKKLNNNAYDGGKDFLEDVELVFQNCRDYNKPGSDAYVMCDSVWDVYQKQVAELELYRYRDSNFAEPEPMKMEVELPKEESAEELEEPPQDFKAEYKAESIPISEAALYPKYEEPVS